MNHADDECLKQVLAGIRDRQWDRALLACRRLLILCPDHEEGLRLSGFAAFQMQRGELAQRLSRRAATANGSSAALLNDLGVIFKAAGRWTDAEYCYRRSMALEPSLGDAASNLGNLMASLRNWHYAAVHSRRAVLLRPDHAEAWNNLANACFAGHRNVAVRQYCLAALILRPAFAEALTNLGNIQHRLKDRRAATRQYLRAIAVDSQHADAFNNMGNLCLEQELPNEARLWLRAALALVPGRAEVANNLSSAARQLRDTAAAEQARKAVRLGGDLSGPLCNLALALQMNDSGLDVRGILVTALCKQPDDEKAFCNLGKIFSEFGEMPMARRCFQRALAIQPDFRAAQQNLVACDLYSDDEPQCPLPTGRRSLGQQGKHLAALPKAVPVRLPAALPTDGRLRIGYLSCDLRDHPVAYAMLPVFRHHDRRAFSVHVYADVHKPDRVTESFRQTVDHWTDVTGLEDDATAARIRADNIHILVCLAGHFDDNRPQVARWRAAPVQISLHDVATSGIEEMDYIVGDPWLLPRNSAEPFSERQLRLPRFYLASIPDTLPAIDSPDADGPPVFSCFNNPSKITPTVLRLWGRILARLPEARLILKYMDSYRAAPLRRRIVDAIAEAGASPEQVTFIPAGREPVGDFLKRYNSIHVALDTLPFSGSTTSFQALLMGVPVVAWPWDRMVSRWTTALLHMLDLAELVAKDGDQYVELALRLAKERAEWLSRRGDLRQRIQERLCDAAAWTRHLERLFKAVWLRHENGSACHGRQPAPVKTRGGR